LEITGRTRIESSTVKRTDRAARSGGKSFSTSEIGEASPSTGLTGSGPIAAVETLLALQGIDDTPDQRSRGLAQADELLLLLDEVRDGLLSGGIPRRTLSRSSRAARPGGAGQTRDERPSAYISLCFITILFIGPRRFPFAQGARRSYNRAAAGTVPPKERAWRPTCRTATSLRTMSRS